MKKSKTLEEISPKNGERYQPKDTVFLFGAGASCGMLPLVNALEQKMEEQASWLENQMSNGNLKLDLVIKEILQEYITSLRELAKNAINYHSIDTYAKQVFLLNRRSGLDYLIFKVNLSLFFLIEQCREGVDSRYDAFFASLLEGSPDSLPSQISVISWNYDSHLELAYHKYFPDLSIDAISEKLGVNEKSFLNHQLFGKFNVFKINGTASSFRAQNNEKEWLHNDFGLKNAHQQSLSSEIGSLLNSYYDLRIHISKRPPSEGFTVDASLNFAWDDPENTTEIVNAARSVLQGAKAVVVVGYSFPFFNRRIDDELMMAIVGNADVYIQDVRANEICEELQLRYPNIKKIRPINIKPNRDPLIPKSRRSQQFFIPTDSERPLGYHETWRTNEIAED